MRPPRGLTAAEAAAWGRLAATVQPLRPRQPTHVVAAAAAPLPKAPLSKAAASVRTSAAAKQSAGTRVRQVPPAVPEAGLDSHWDRKFARGAIAPDFTLDLHGHTLDRAHAQLEAGLAQAKAMGARVVLVIAGKPRPAEAADRGSTRGAIRAKLLDWLAAGPHAGDVAAVRSAHRRHGGEGALYLVLRRAG